MSLNRDCTVYARNNGNVMHSIMRYFYVSHLLRLCIGTWNQIREIHTKIQYGLHLVQVILNEIDTQFYQSTKNPTTDYLVCVIMFGTTDTYTKTRLLQTPTKIPPTLRAATAAKVFSQGLVLA